jgi:surface polysaccharide O-acyltransferase-like enzyme
MYLNSFNYFRAIAILVIVAGHCLSRVGFNHSTEFEKAIFNFLLGGTCYFVFISGFLFHYIFHKKFNFRAFAKGKVKNVLVPYLILGIIPAGYLQLLLLWPWGDIEQYIPSLINRYWSGRALLAYWWYVPFIMTVFCLSPLHVKYIKMGFKSQLLIALLWSLVALFIHRPIANLNVIQSVVYFTPFYLFGILSSKYWLIISKYLKRRELYFLLAAILFSIAEVVTGHVGNYHKPALIYGGIDFNFLQKLSMCMFFMLWMQRFEKTEIKWLKVVADTSFAIFFIHPFFMVAFGARNIEYSGVYSWLVWLALIVVVVSACVAIALALKKITPKYSRYITGY